MRSWRSPLWNVVLMVLMAAMAGLATSTAFDGPNAVVVGLFGTMAVVFWVATVRSLFLGVFAKPHGIVMRGFTHTTTIPWGEVEGIEGARMGSGAAGMAGAVAPVVVRRRPNGKVQRVELNVVGGYGLSNVRPTPAERAIAGLNEAWAEWKQRNTAQSAS